MNPRSLATTVRFEYGTTTSYGTATPEQAIGAGGSTVAVTAAIGGLRAGHPVQLPRRRHERRGRHPRRQPHVHDAARPDRRGHHAVDGPAHVGHGVTITGTVSGSGTTPVALEKQDFPFTGPFAQVATATASSTGAFSLTAPPLFVTTRLRVVTRTAVVATSAVTTASVAVKVGLKTKRLHGPPYPPEGAIWPSVPNGRVSLQRQSRSGRWVP